MKRGGSFALGRLKVGAMNRTEALYAETLAADPNVVWFKFEGLKLRLADNTFYTPDFFVMLANGEFEAHECKGYWQDDAKVKIKVAAEMYPIRFIAIKIRPVSKKNGGGLAMETEEF